MQMTQVRNQIKQHQFTPFYVLYGSETFLLEEMKQMIIEQAVEEASRSFNVSRFDMAEVPVDMAIEEAEVLPFIGERRVVVIDNPIFLTGKTDNSKIEHHLAKLEQYLDHPSPFSIMIFVADYEKLDQRKKLVKKLKKAGEVLAFSSLNETDIYEILQQRAKQEGVVFSKEAHERLLQFIGPDLLHLTSEVDKMVLYAGKNGKIDVDTVDLLSAKTLEANVFTLIDKVAGDRMDEGFSILHDLFKQNEEPIKLLALLARQFRVIFQVKKELQEGYSQSQISKQLKLHPYAVKVAAAQARSLQSKQLLEMLNECVETDFAMKTGKMDKRLALELLLSKLGPQKSEASN